MHEVGQVELLAEFIRQQSGQLVNTPWLLVEVKSSKNRPLSKQLEYFKTRIGAKYAFQIMMDADFENTNCFDYSYPIRVSGRLFLSQLV